VLQGKRNAIGNKYEAFVKSRKFEHFEHVKNFRAQFGVCYRCVAFPVQNRYILHQHLVFRQSPAVVSERSNIWRFEGVTLLKPSECRHMRQEVGQIDI